MSSNHRREALMANCVHGVDSSAARVKYRPTLMECTFGLDCIFFWFSVTRGLTRGDLTKHKSLNTSNTAVRLTALRHRRTWFECRVNESFDCFLLDFDWNAFTLFILTSLGRPGIIWSTFWLHFLGAFLLKNFVNCARDSIFFWRDEDRTVEIQLFPSIDLFLNFSLPVWQKFVRLKVNYRFEDGCFPGTSASN